MQDVAKNLENEARRSEALVIWTDCDREGLQFYNYLDRR
jgi:DNA topoisomerase IA